ncbi:hypothetical protein LDENG_00080770 [Lucifuga dentata]|nr:hypothetical protein LDENG_00080770 [Lucifuga dentata]
MKMGKSPGMDGFPIEYYKKFLDILVPILMKVYLEAFNLESLPNTFNEALISLIPKRDRNALDPSNYRPISLINVDCKILAKILASRLEKVLPSIINSDQVGFIKGRSSSDNLRRLLHLTWQNSSNSLPVAAISLDAEKAFDRVEWRFLTTALSSFGFDSVFKLWISIPYKNPKAAVIVNGVISPFFNVLRGTHQGCPLSPLLFTFFFFLEPLAIMIRADPNIKEVNGAGKEHK